MNNKCFRKKSFLEVSNVDEDEASISEDIVPLRATKNPLHCQFFVRNLQ